MIQSYNANSLMGNWTFMSINKALKSNRKRKGSSLILCIQFYWPRVLKANMKSTLLYVARYTCERHARKLHRLHIPVKALLFTAILYFFYSCAKLSYILCKMEIVIVNKRSFFRLPCGFHSYPRHVMLTFPCCEATQHKLSNVLP